MPPSTRSYTLSQGIILPPLFPYPPTRRATSRHPIPENPICDPTITTCSLANIDYDVWMEILSWMTLPSLLALMGSSRLFRTAITSYVWSRFSLLLKEEYLLHPDIVRDLMRANGYFINGHTCTQFIRNQTVGTSGLNFLAYRDCIAPLVGHLYQQNFRQVVLPTPWGTAAQNAGLTKIITFVRENPKKRRFAKVNIKIVNPRFDIHRTLAFATTTASMAYFTADAIHVVFPHFIFNDLAIVPLHGGTNLLSIATMSAIQPSNLPGHLGRNIHKLIGDGIDVRYWSVGWEGEPCGYACPALQRKYHLKNLTFSLVFDPQASDPYESQYDEGDRAVASYLQLVLSGRCHNESCSNFWRFWFVPFIRRC